MPRVLIYRSRLLPISETFVRQHYDSLHRYKPIFAGLCPLEGIDVSDTDPLFLTSSLTTRKPKIALFKQFGYAPRFLRRLAAAKPDLIHAHFAVDAADMLPVAKFLGIPLIVTLHGYDVTTTDAGFRQRGVEGRIFLSKRTRLFRKATHFLPVSRFIEAEALAIGAPRERMTLHYLGIDRTQLQRPDGPRENAVLYVGRLIEKKGLNLLVEALDRAGANDSGTVLRIIGDGPNRQEYLDLAAARLKHVEYLGPQPHERVIDEMARAQVFSVPSIPASSGDNEGLPISYMEASAMGLPIVSFAQGGILEAVKDGETGLLAPTGDIDALAGHLKRLLGDADLCARLGTAGRAYVEEVFDIGRCAERLEEIYDDILAHHPAKQ